MHKAVWIIVFLISVPTVRAGEWEKLSTDLELLENVISDDEMQMQHQQEDALLDDSADLFPGLEDEDEEVVISDEEEKFLTIQVRGLPVELWDVPLEEWFAPFVEKAAQLNLISGYGDDEGNPTGEFGPADFVTVEQLAKMAVVAAGIDIYNCGDSMLNKSAAGRWSQKYIQCAEHHNWAVFSDGSIKVHKPARRAEVAVTVIQAFSVRVSPVSGSIFEDVGRSTPYGNAIETLSKNGVVSGYTGSNGNPTGYFGPSDPVNRAETAKIFSLSSQTYGDR
ncbi:MAG: S-layer homology domain-containing protein [Candidatus Peribacter sp.]|jgi:hypothetical protein|nr:S-layer homology domain-containing protein [Candidatus Peribacter sp.]MBT4393035.1 S-layer homology domain-containing protein [Candidatus Peribacter sp.]MBT4600386.1 S-layer homology domain-containing protein [Candidatus Peribacter sp.]MBT5149344.1 S-layer homology domain-containing protein [Candidatus Peribacter sp.]MBT5637593.1 S-layer homology domain-containing protein [Candidatus Peribacter sp.]